eukprot:ANDGO_01748.mRNA.1 hypothetical protein
MREIGTLLESLRAAKNTLESTAQAKRATTMVVYALNKEQEETIQRKESILSTVEEAVSKREELLQDCSGVEKEVLGILEKMKAANDDAQTLANMETSAQNLKAQCAHMENLVQQAEATKTELSQKKAALHVDLVRTKVAAETERMSVASRKSLMDAELQRLSEHVRQMEMQVENAQSETAILKAQEQEYEQAIETSITELRNAVELANSEQLKISQDLQTASTLYDDADHRRSILSRNAEKCTTKIQEAQLALKLTAAQQLAWKNEKLKLEEETENARQKLNKVQEKEAQLLEAIGDQERITDTEKAVLNDLQCRGKLLRDAEESARLLANELQATANRISRGEWNDQASGLYEKLRLTVQPLLSGAVTATAAIPDIEELAAKTRVMRSKRESLSVEILKLESLRSRLQEKQAHCTDDLKALQENNAVIQQRLQEKQLLRDQLNARMAQLSLQKEEQASVATALQSDLESKHVNWKDLAAVLANNDVNVENFDIFSQKIEQEMERGNAAFLEQATKRIRDILREQNAAGAPKNTAPSVIPSFARRVSTSEHSAAPTPVVEGASSETLTQREEWSVRQTVQNGGEADFVDDLENSNEVDCAALQEDARESRLRSPDTEEASKPPGRPVGSFQSGQSVDKNFTVDRILQEIAFDDIDDVLSDDYCQKHLRKDLGGEPMESAQHMPVVSSPVGPETDAAQVEKRTAENERTTSRRPALSETGTNALLKRSNPYWKPGSTQEKRGQAISITQSSVAAAPILSQVFEFGELPQYGQSPNGPSFALSLQEASQQASSKASRVRIAKEEVRASRWRKNIVSAEAPPLQPSAPDYLKRSKRIVQEIPLRAASLDKEQTRPTPVRKAKEADFPCEPPQMRASQTPPNAPAVPCVPQKHAEENCTAKLIAAPLEPRPMSKNKDKDKKSSLHTLSATNAPAPKILKAIFEFDG